MNNNFDILQRFAKCLIDNGDGTFSLRLGGSGSTFYIGDANTNGSWRFTIVSNDLSVQRRESGVWVEKSLFQAS